MNGVNLHVIQVAPFSVLRITQSLLIKLKNYQQNPGFSAILSKTTTGKANE